MPSRRNLAAAVKNLDIGTLSPPRSYTSSPAGFDLPPEAPSFKTGVCFGQVADRLRY